MDMRRHRQILAAGHQAYPLDRVIYGDRKVVARRYLLAGEHYIAEYSGLRSLPAFPPDPLERAGQRERTGAAEPQRIIDPRTQLWADLSGAEPPASTGIRRAGIPVPSAASTRAPGQRP